MELKVKAQLDPQFEPLALVYRDFQKRVAESGSAHSAFTRSALPRTGAPGANGIAGKTDNTYYDKFAVA